MRILLVEDDQPIAYGLKYSLESEGYDVVLSGSVGGALRALGEQSFDLLLLDLSLPDGSGFDVCRAAKAKGDAAIIFLTARDEEVSVVMGLDMGADDYITKPFRLRELLSRVKSVLRRSGTQAGDPVLRFGGLSIDTQRAYVAVDGREVHLTAMEYRLLLTFASNPGQVLSRSQLLEGIWDVAGSFVNDNTLTVYIKRLREKLGEAGDADRLLTVRGLGYKMEVE